MFGIRTPLRKQTVKSLARRSYTKAASSTVKSNVMLGKVLSEITIKIKREMRQLSGDENDSILRDNVEAVKQFNWDIVLLEFQKKVPTLIRFLQLLIPQPSDQKPLLCFIASQILKARHQRLCLVQRAVSVMLYGNGASKQVF